MAKQNLQIQENNNSNKENNENTGESPYLTGTVDLGVLGKHSIALWQNDAEENSNQPALKGSLRRKNNEGRYEPIGDVALWINQP